MLDRHPAGHENVHTAGPDVVDINAVAAIPPAILNAALGSQNFLERWSNNRVVRAIDNASSTLAGKIMMGVVEVTNFGIAADITREVFERHPDGIMTKMMYEGQVAVPATGFVLAAMWRIRSGTRSQETAQVIDIKSAEPATETHTLEHDVA